MTETIYLLNLKFDSLVNELEESSGFNSDGTMNIPYTLERLRDKLEHVIDVVNTLLSKEDQIIDMDPYGVNRIQIITKTPETMQELIRNGTVYTETLSNGFPEENIEDVIIEEPDVNEETHSERKKRVLNLCNTDNSTAHSDESDESDEDLILQDEKNLKTITELYKTLLDEEQD